ncbi:uncharacterized protein [Tenebrio molitor]|uniref:uncharacterized protein n=1 Tax=Tenebrio molitor TaxID=7067 RepID=UPI00362482AE
MEKIDKRNIKQFNGERYSIWKFRVKSLLRELNILHAVEDAIPDLPDEHWLKADSTARGVIVDYLSDAFLSFAKEMDETLKTAESKTVIKSDNHKADKTVNNYVPFKTVKTDCDEASNTVDKTVMSENDKSGTNKTDKSLDKQNKLASHETDKTVDKSVSHETDKPVKEISETDKSVTPIRRSERIKNRPQPCYNDELTEMQTYLNCMITFHNTTIPKSYTEIKEREDRKQWEDAINEEIQALEVNQTWTLIDKPIGAEVITQAEVLQRIQKAVESKRTSAPGSSKRQSSKLKTLKFDDSSSDESLEEPMYTEDKDDMDPEDFGNDEDVCDTEIEIGRWVLVKYPTKKAVKHFVAQVLGKEEEGWNLKFTEYKQEKFKWPIEMDTDVMNDQDIIRVLPDPILGRRESDVANPDQRP